MYADRLETESGSRKTVKNRLNGVSSVFSTRRKLLTRKRERQDEKWEHDLFNEDKPQLPKRRVDPRDLRLKLQKKHHVLQSGQRASLGVRDLREKLSRTVNPQPKSSNPPKSKREATRPAIKGTKLETRTALNQATKKKSEQADASVDRFLESMGLEKYSTAFQVEEVDMDSLMHMTDDDLKALFIPMGPRKKILRALGSKGR